ncbi:unnamed protein product [Closterium sp. NIES-53]
MQMIASHNTVDLLKQHILAAETSVVAVGAAHGTLRTPFFEGCSPSPLAPSYASATAADVPGAVDVRAASASAKCRNSKGKGGRGCGGGSGGGGGRSGGGGRAVEVVAVVGAVGVAVVAAVGVVAAGLELCVEVLEEARGSSNSVGARPRRPSSFAELLRSGVAIFDLDFDAILAAMYALSTSAEGDCYLCVPPDPGIEVAALGASESVLPSTAPAEALPPSHLTQVPHAVHSSAKVLSVHLATGPPQVAASAKVSTSGQVAPPCSCHLLSHQTLLWHHRLGHPSLPHLRGMHSRLLFSGRPRSLPPLSLWPAPPCLPCVEGRQRAASYSSLFPPTTAPLQTLHMDVKGQVVDVLIPWIRAVRLQLCERFHTDLPVLRLHSYRGGEFSSDLLRDFCRGEGILQSFTLSDSPLQNGIAECRIGLVTELNLWPRVSLLEISPTLRWTGKVGDASMFRVWGSRTFVRDMSADKLSVRAIPCVFLGFSPNTPGWQFYHPTSRRVFPSQDVTFDEPGPAPSGVSQVDPLLGTAPIEVAVGSGAAPDTASGGAESEGAGSGVLESEGAGSGGAEPGGAEPVGVEPRGAEPAGVELGGTESEGAESGGAEPRGTASSRDPADASPRLYYVMLSFAFTSVCLPSYVRVLHAWCERVQEFVFGVVWIF